MSVEHLSHAVRLWSGESLPRGRIAALAVTGDLRLAAFATRAEGRESSKLTFVRAGTTSPTRLTVPGRYGRGLVAVSDLAFSADGDILLAKITNSWKETCQLLAYDLATGRPRWSVTTESGPMAVTSDGRVAIAVGPDPASGKRRRIEVREVGTGERVGAVQTPFTRTVCGVAFSPDDRELVVVGVAGNGDVEAAWTYLNDPGSTATVRLAERPAAKPVHCPVGWSNDGPIAVLRNGYGLHVLDPLTAERRSTLELADSTAVAELSGDGRMLVVATADEVSGWPLVASARAGRRTQSWT